jgi:hypothetical protein
MVWINDQRIKDAQTGLLKAGFPTQIKIIGRREFLMVISLKKLKKAVETHTTRQAKYEIYDASTGKTPRLGIILVGDFRGLTIENYGLLLKKMEAQGFKTTIEMSEDFKMIRIEIDLTPLINVFTMRGIPKRLFKENIKVVNSNPYLVIHFRG